ncbi:sucrase ferredoxin [Tomitella cavernea]|uniref:Sucrase ferredoxin n=1 Tax=Tomitella cavernea TaxID=1387982 RepID=A0ABP9C4Z5_9ACTN|nr:sucrase ferredoxin [Tomitella cavernea]
MTTPAADPLRCSQISALDEPLRGTATHVGAWLCLEHPAPWGRDIFDGTAFGDELTALLKARVDDAGTRLMLIRRPGRPAGDAGTGRAVYLARSHPDRVQCARLTVDTPRDLLDVDLTWATDPAATPPGHAVTDPVTLVCTHGRRDVCCAIDGRPIAATLAGAPHPTAEHVWECSHTGGHRFAPSMIVLPTGYSYGRVGADEAEAAVRGIAGGTLPTAGLRGRSCWDQPGQAAELAVRERLAAERVPLNALVVHSDGPDSRTVAHRDGRQWRIATRTEPLAPRTSSCGAAPKAVAAVRVEAVTPL